jgi:monoamine oxidase
MSVLTDYLFEGANVHVSCEVKSVALQTSGQLIVKYLQNGSEQTWTGDRIICTVSLGVLKLPSSETGGISWSPQLRAEKQTAIRRLEMKNIRKLTFTFTTSAWEAAMVAEPHKPIDKTFWLGGGEWTNVNAIAEVEGAVYPTIQRWLLAEKADEVEHLPPFDSGLKDASLALIREVFPDLTSEALVGYEDNPWAQNPYTRGSYSYVPCTAEMNDSAEFMTPEMESRLFFAGEHTAVFYEASLHGAHISGKRAANQVLESLL